MRSDHPLAATTVTESPADYRKRIFNEIPQLPQRQDSLHDQLADLQAVANRLGMYDAADVIRELLNEPGKG